MNKSEQKQVERAIKTGNAEYLASTIAIMHRAASKKSQAELLNAAYNLRLMSFLTIENGCLIRIDYEPDFNEPISAEQMRDNMTVINS